MRASTCRAPVPDADQLNRARSADSLHSHGSRHDRTDDRAAPAPLSPIRAPDADGLPEVRILDACRKDVGSWDQTCWNPTGSRLTSRFSMEDADSHDTFSSVHLGPAAGCFGDGGVRRGSRVGRLYQQFNSSLVLASRCAEVLPDPSCQSDREFGPVGPEKSPSWWRRPPPPPVAIPTAP